MAAPTYEIGTETHSTWACLRAPIWRQTGFQGEFPDVTNVNWNHDHSAGYPDNLTPLLKAAPFSGYESALSPPAYSASTCLGKGGTFLNLGSGQYYSGGFDYVSNGFYEFGGNFYDYESVRSILLGAVVNITSEAGYPDPPITQDVTITEDLFVSDYNSYSTGVTIPDTQTFGPYTINSLTLP